MGTVFILGAGFSVPLGGPLFSQVLTQSQKCHWQEMDFEADWLVLFERIHNGEVQEYLQVDWNAEQLLHWVDWMARNLKKPITRKFISRFKLQSVGGDATFIWLLNKYLKRVVVAQCERFLDDVEESSDLWDPYRQWLSELGPDDVIITFNYDTAVERVAARIGPGFDEDGLCKHDSKGTLPMLIKLHGSATWAKNESPATIEYIDYAYDINVDMAIGSPGLGKATMHENGPFKELWSDAHRAIVKSEYVHLIGYSMPHTDNRARMMILKALGEGRDNKLRVCIVVGDDVKVSKRLLSIIRPVLGKDPNYVANTNMYAQDFIANVKQYRHGQYAD